MFCFFAAMSAQVMAGDLFRVVKNASELKSSPAFSLSSPLGFSGAANTAFIGVGGSAQQTTLDGALALGTGFGNPSKDLGGSISLVVPSLSFDGGFFEKGGLSVAVGHNFDKENAGISVGMTGLDLWRSATSPKEDPSFYLSGSKAFMTVVPTIVTVGFGNNQFSKAENGDTSPNKLDVFASVGAYLCPQLSVIADYTAGVTTLGTSVVPMPDLPISMTLGVNGFFKENAGDALVVVGSLGFGIPYGK
jgi:hypothetical protein